MSESRLRSITIEEYLKYVEMKRQTNPDADISAEKIIVEMSQLDQPSDESIDSMLATANDFSKVEFTRVKHRHFTSNLFACLHKTDDVDDRRPNKYHKKTR